MKPNLYKLIILLWCLFMPLGSTAAKVDIDHHASEGSALEKDGDYVSALSHYALLLNSYSDTAPTNDQCEYASVFKHAGDVCNMLGRYVESLEYYTMGYQAAERGGDKLMMIRCLGNIGNVHGTFEDFGRAITYYNRGYEVATDIGSAIDQYKFLLNMAFAYSSIGHTKEALEAFRRLQLVNDNSFSPVMKRFHSEYVQGAIASSGGNHVISRHYYQEALRIGKEANLDTLNLADQLLNIGDSYLNTGNPDSAKSYYNESLRLCREADVVATLPKLYDSMSNVYKISGDTTEMRHFQDLSRCVRDSIFNIREYLDSKNKLTEYEEMISSTKISNLNQKLTVQYIILIFAAIILAIIISFSLIIVKRNKELKFANKKLVDKNQELIKSEEKSRELTEKYLQAVTQNKEPYNLTAMVDTDNISDKVKDNADLSGTEKDTETAYLSDEQINVILSRINKVLDSEEHLFNPDFSLNILSRLVKTNTKYVSWVINETYGKNFKTVLNELRIKEASKRLEDHENYGNITIQAIAEEVGYKSSTSFIQAFKRIVGVTPAVYQRLSAEKDSEGKTQCH